MNDLNFDIDSAPVSEYAPLDGVFLVEVVHGEVKGDQTKGGVKVTYELLEGKSGFKVTEYFNLNHPNEKATQIGRGQFAKRCKDMGLAGMVKSTDELSGKQILLRVKPEESTQINPKTGMPYVNTTVKGSYPKDKRPKEKATEGKLETVKPEIAFDEDDIPF